MMGFSIKLVVLFAYLKKKIEKHRTAGAKMAFSMGRAVLFTYIKLLCGFSFYHACLYCTK